MNLLAGERHQESFITKKYYGMLLGGVLSSVIVSLMLMADTIVAGIFVGAHAVSAVNLITPVYSLAAALGLLFSDGVPILYARAVGNFDREMAEKTYGLGLTACVGSGLILFLFLFFAGDRYLAFFNVSPAVYEEARAYLKWMKYVILMMPLSALVPNMVFADGNELLSTIASVSSAVVNLVLSVILSRSMGIVGIGIGSVVGDLTEFFICGFHYLNKNNSLRPRINFSLKPLLTIVSYSATDASTYLYLSVFLAVLTKYFAAHYPPDMLILISVITFVTEMQVFLDGIGESINPIMSIYFPCGCFAGVRRIWRLAVRTAIVMGVGAMVLLALLAPLVPRILGISDPALVSMAVTGARILSLSLPFVSLLYLLTSYYMMTDRIFDSVIITGFFSLIFPLPLSILFGYLFGLYGVYFGVVAGIAASWYISRIYVVLRYGRDQWPLNLGDAESRIRSELFSLTVTPQEIIRVQRSVEKILTEEGIGHELSMKVLLLTEEILMEVFDRNPDKPALGEYSLVVTKNCIRMVEMDDGVIFEDTNEDIIPTSFRAYILSELSSRLADGSKYLKTMSFNRNMFEVNRENGV